MYRVIEKDGDGYLYWCYNYNEMGYKVGPLDEARMHKFNFKEKEIESLKQNYPDFDNKFVVVDWEES